MPTVIFAMATVVLYIVIKVYWDSSTIFSSYHDFNIKFPGAPPGWFRDQAAYIIFNFSSQGRVTISHDPPQDGQDGHMMSTITLADSIFMMTHMLILGKDLTAIASRHHD